MISFSQFRNLAQDRMPFMAGAITVLVGAAVVVTTTGLLSVMPATAQTLAPKPVIQAKLSGTALVGVSGSYCWPLPGKSPCALIEDPQPKNFTPANPGDVITFSLDPADQTASLIATFLDDLQADGKPLQVDLTAAQNAYTVDPSLSSGPHRIEVDAAYPALADGSQNYVAYVFGIQLNNPNVAAVTLSAQTTAVANNATIAVTGGSPVATSVAGPSTGVASTIISPSALPSATPTAIPTDTPFPTATNTSTDIPTATPTITPSPTATETYTFTPSPTATATLTPSVTPTSTGIALGNGLNIPKLALQLVGDKSFDPVAVTASIQDSSGALITITRPIDASSPFARAAVNTVVQLQFSGPKPVSELASLQTGDATKLISQQVLTPNITALYGLPDKAGLYTLSIAVQWAQGSATYIFHVQVTG